MSNIVHVDQSDTNDFNYKREAYDLIFTKIVAVQETYHALIREMIKGISSTIPSSQDDVNRIDLAEDQIDLMSTHVGKLEDLKYFASLALLSEGSLITLDELGYALSSIDQMAAVATLETKSDQGFIRSWAKQKLELFEQATEILNQILDHKIKRRHKIGEIEIH